VCASDVLIAQGAKHLPVALSVLLTQAIQKTSGGSTLHSYSFGFDPAGNMTSKSVDGTSTTFTYNAANELTQASGGINKTYTYDGNGDLTSISDGTQLTPNAAGQITSITPPGGGPITMTYTGVGETQRVGAGTKNYQYDAAGLSKQTDGSNSTSFTSLPDGTVISESVSGSIYYYLSDGAGSVAGLMDSTGALKNQYSYDPLVQHHELLGNHLEPVHVPGRHLRQPDRVLQHGQRIL